MFDDLVLGIDLGGVCCRAAWFNLDSGEIEMLSPKNGGWPAALYASDEGLLTGEEGASRFEGDPGAGLFYRTAKAAMGERAIYDLGRTQIDPAGVATALLASAKRQAELRVGKPFPHLVVAHPASHDALAQDALRGAAREAGFSQVTLVADPVAAAAAAARGEMGLGKHVLVCDIGAASSSVSALADDGRGAYACATKSKIVPVGCEHLDRALAAYVGERLRGEKRLAVHEEAILSNACTLARKALTTDERVQIRVGATEAEFEIDRKTFERIAGPRLEEIRRAIVETIREATNAGRPPECLLLTGGGARLPFAEAMFGSQLPVVPVSSDRDEAVVRGAACIGSRRAIEEAEFASRYDTPEFREFLEDYRRKALERQLVVLLAGRTGVGKSSTANSLLGRKVAPVGDFEACTFEIATYDTELEGVRFRIVDTPGLCDKPIEESNDDFYVAKMRASVKSVDSLWFVTELTQPRPPGDDERRAIRVLSRAFADKAAIWKSAVIIFTCANDIKPPERFEETLRVKTAQLRKAIAEYAGAEIAAKIPAVAVENTADTTPDGKEWRGNLYTEVCLTIARGGFASWMFATFDLVDRPASAREADLDGDPLRAIDPRSRLANRPNGAPKSRIRQTEEQEAAVRDRARAEIVSSFEARGAAIGGKLGGDLGRAVGGRGSTAERVMSDIGSGFGRAVGKFCGWLLGKG